MPLFLPAHCICLISRTWSFCLERGCLRSSNIMSEFLCHERNKKLKKKLKNSKWDQARESELHFMFSRIFVVLFSSDKLRPSFRLLCLVMARALILDFISGRSFVSFHMKGVFFLPKYSTYCVLYRCRKLWFVQQAIYLGVYGVVRAGV